MPAPVKTFYFDLETTGLNPEKHAIIQLAHIIDIDGEIVEEGEFLIRPYEKDLIDDEALKVNKRTREEIAGFEDPDVVFWEIVNDLLDKHIDRFDKTDKFYPAGYNIESFDIPFMREYFRKAENPYYGSYFNYKPIDPMRILFWLNWMGKINLPNLRLETVCNYCGIKINAHDAVSDTRAARELILRMRKVLK